MGNAEICLLKYLQHFKTFTQVPNLILAEQYDTVSNFLEKAEAQIQRNAHKGNTKNDAGSSQEEKKMKVYKYNKFNPNLPTFHQLLHFPQYIRHFGAPINFDGSCPEAFGKDIVKLSAFQKQRSISTEQPDFLNGDL